MFYSNRAEAHFGKKNYDESWADVKMAQKLGYPVEKAEPAFLQALRQASGRQQ